jgi:hypothetical protein
MGVQIWRPTTFMRQITAAAPGMVDFFAMLEILRSRHKPQEKVLEITTAYTQSAITPRTMTAAADGHMDAVCLHLSHHTRHLCPCLKIAFTIHNVQD